MPFIDSPIKSAKSLVDSWVFSEAINTFFPNALTERIIIGASSMIFLGSSTINNHSDRYKYISGSSTVDLKVFDKRTGKMFVRSRDFVTEYDIINGYYRVRTYSLYEE